MALLCREFDISRKTGHEIFNRFRECGLEGLTDRSRRPYRQANRLPFQIEALILQLKKEHPGLGSPQDPREDPPPPQRDQFAGHQYRSRGPRAEQSGEPGARASLPCTRDPLSRPTRPNDLWCADYKGEFRLADKRYCYPLTITDSVSRYWERRHSWAEAC